MNSSGDIFATVVCGPAHYVSCIDMAVRLAHDPFRLDYRDEHPPTATRVYACYRTLTQEQRSQPVVEVSRSNWDDAAQTYARNAEYQLFCPEPLVDQLVDTTISLISALVRVPNGTAHSTSWRINSSVASRVQMPLEH